MKFSASISYALYAASVAMAMPAVIKRATGTSYSGGLTATDVTDGSKKQPHTPPATNRMNRKESSDREGRKSAQKKWSNIVTHRMRPLDLHLRPWLD